MMNQEAFKPLLPYRLQLFAEGAGGERTEPATPRRRQKAREEGQVAHSTEVATALLFIMLFSALKIFGPGMMEDLTNLFRNTYQFFSIREIDIPLASELVGYMIRSLLGILTPIMIITVLIGFGSNFIQVGWHPTLKPMVPKFNKLSPANGFKRMFSSKALIELLKSLLKITIILVIAYFSVRDYEKLILTIYDLPLIDAYGLIFSICLDIGIKVGVFFVAVALVDFLYKRHELNKGLKMSKYEIKQEYKETEGNPEIKGKIRQKMREASMRRMMQDLPKADVIITNPTHFAVAIQYDSEKSIAPIVIAKGADLIAAKIREIGKQNGIELYENKPLARTLFYTVEIGDEIPPELYQTVAEVLAFVYSLKNSTGKGARA